MRNRLTALASVLGVALTGLALQASNAFAATQYGISGVASGAASGIGADVTSVLPYIGGLIALVVGIRLARKFLKV